MHLLGDELAWYLFVAGPMTRWVTVGIIQKIENLIILIKSNHALLVEYRELVLPKLCEAQVQSSQLVP